MKNDSKYLTGYLDEVVRPVVLILPKRSDVLKILKRKIIN